MGRVFWGYWDCSFCGSNDISGKIRTCPTCGKPRDNNVVFHPNPHGGDKNSPRDYVTDPKLADSLRNGPDWHCSYCGSLNSAAKSTCPSCGHTRAESDRNYFELHPERNHRTIPADDKDVEDNDRSDDHSSQSTSAPAAYGSAQKEFCCPTHTGPSINWGRVGKITLIVLAIITLVVGALYVFLPKERYILVTDISWRCSRDVQEYRTVHESGWSVPTGGRTQYTQLEIHHYDRVLDHYESVQKSRQVITGSHEEVTGYHDLGNGAFEEITRIVYDYGTEYYTEQEPVYRDNPVYQIKYYYDIERWVYDHTIRSSAHDKEPYWPTEDLKENQRFAGRSLRFIITAVENNKTADYYMNHWDWEGVNIGQRLHVKVYPGNHIEPIEDP